MQLLFQLSIYIIWCICFILILATSVILAKYYSKWHIFLKVFCKCQRRLTDRVKTFLIATDYFNTVILVKTSFPTWIFCLLEFIISGVLNGSSCANKVLKICPKYALFLAQSFHCYLYFTVTEALIKKHVDFLPASETRSLLHAFWKRESFQPWKGWIILSNVKIPQDPSSVDAISREVETGLMSTIFQITPQKMKFSIKDFTSKCDQIRKKLWIWWHLLKKSSM